MFFSEVLLAHFSNCESTMTMFFILQLAVPIHITVDVGEQAQRLGGDVHRGQRRLARVAVHRRLLRQVHVVEVHVLELHFPGPAT